MKVTFNKDELKNRLAQLGAVVSSKATSPVLSFVRLFANELSAMPPTYQVGIVGADTFATLTVVLQKAVADGPVDILVPFHKLAELVNNANKVGEIIIEAKDQTKSVVTAGKAKGTLPSYPVTNWPDPLVRPDTATATIPLPAFKNSISTVEFAIPKEAGKHIAAVALIESTPTSFQLIGCDGEVLAISTFAQEAGSTFELLLPRPALELITKLSGPALSISHNDSGFYFDTEFESLTFARSHGAFPNYKGVLPKSVTGSFEVDSAELLEALNWCVVLADKEKPAVTFIAKGDALNLEGAHLEASSAEGATFRNVATNELAIAPLTGTPTDFSLNAKRTVQFLTKVTGKIQVAVVSANAVVDFQAGSLRFLQMPTNPANRA